MKITHVRNATSIVEYADQRFLIDPFFADKGTMSAFQNTTNQHLNNPLVELPLPIENLTDVDAVIVTHLHPDHFDDKAKHSLPKDIPLYAQNAEDKDTIKEAGFTNVSSYEKDVTIGGIKLVHTEGQHGSKDMTEITGSVSGIVFTHPDEKTLYIAGDTIWYKEVQQAIDTHRPEVIVVNAGAAQFLEGGPITMTKEDILRTHQESPESDIIVVHMEALNHCLLSREELYHYLESQETNRKIVIPSDGDMMTY